MAKTTIRIWSITTMLVTLITTGVAFAGEAPLHVEGGPQVQRGANLARIADCMGCHTYKEDKPYAGNKPMESPFGVFYTSNLTQDDETGLGTWTYEDFKRALHHGKRKSGNYIYPAMPFVSYTKISDDDVKALWAYFKTIKPIHNKVRDPKLIVLSDHFSSMARLALLGWRIPFFDAGRFKPDPNRSAEYNKGAYYVHALGHCSSCHTPRNIAFAQKKDQFLDGFTLNGWYAPRLSPGPDSAIKDLSVDQLTDLLKNGDLKTKTALVGPMNEVWHDSLRHMQRADLHAIAFYLKNMPPNEHPKPVPKPIPIEPEQAKLGQDVYAKHCATCHGDDGQGTYGVAPALDRNNLVIGDDANSVVMAILVGFAPENVWGAMPSFARQLDDKQIAAVANYVRTAWHNDVRSDATTDMVASSRSHAKSSLPPGGVRPAAHCPSLPAEQIRPALAFKDDALLNSFDNPGQIQQFATRYKAARGNASNGDTIKALTAVYCRALAKKKPDESMDTRDNHVFEYSQKIAEALGE
ncbi:cytochrome c [Salinisphaera sp. Q1T1-3]|uniref:cytochrome c n=1 Tax=Salinisphaera sp. Q1T1-3 TaxID=2321229 RepID=UPI00131467F3|nr:cytochrome c [Salinisphaera sp. Q1T1-3]